MSSTARCVRQSADSAYWLFSQMKTTGSFQVAARFIPSCTAPWPAAPSPKYATTAWSVPRSFAVSPAPQACGMPAPTIPLQPRMSSERSAMCIEPPSPWQ